LSYASRLRAIVGLKEAEGHQLCAEGHQVGAAGIIPVTAELRGATLENFYRAACNADVV